MLKDLKAVAEPSELAGAYVLVDHTHFSGHNDLRIKYSYDEFGNYVKLPPEEWTLLGSNYGVEIYEVPDGWTYNPPDGKEFVYAALMHALDTENYDLFLNCLHPNLLSQLNENKRRTLYLKCINRNDQMIQQIFEKHLVYKELGKLWKIDFVDVLWE